MKVESNVRPKRLVLVKPFPSILPDNIIFPNSRIVIEADRTSIFQQDTTALVETDDEHIENSFQQIVENEEDQDINTMSF